MDPAEDASFGLLAAALEDSLDALVADYLARLAGELPEWTSERPELADTLRLGAVASIGGEVRALRGGQLPASCPTTDAEGARQCAALGVPLHAVVLQYRLGHAVQWDAWFRLVERHDPAPAMRRALLERASRFLFAYADRMTRFAIEEYTTERESMVRGREQHRVVLVRELLQGRDVQAAALGYRPADHHVGVVASGEAAAEAVTRAAAALDRRLLLVRADETTWWAWLGGDRPLDDRARRALRRFTPPPAARFGFGEESAGADGLRRSHREAVVAHAAAERRGVAVVGYDSVALEALAGADPEAARAFVERELQGIDGDDLRSRRLRGTLLAYFRAGHNAAGAAAVLGVHQQTVAQRLRAVEDRIGRPVIPRRAELETALRLREHLAPRARRAPPARRCPPATPPARRGPPATPPARRAPPAGPRA